jgi:hypothetical protein
LVITERRQPELALAKRLYSADYPDEESTTLHLRKELDSRFIAVSRNLAVVHGGKISAEPIGLTDRDLFSTEHAKAALADERIIIHTGKPIIDYEEKETWPDRDDTGFRQQSALLPQRFPNFFPAPTEENSAVRFYSFSDPR